MFLVTTSSTDAVILLSFVAVWLAVVSDTLAWLEVTLIRPYIAVNDGLTASCVS